jgi:hypothetical protein
MCLNVQPPRPMPAETGAVGKLILKEDSPYRMIGDQIFDRYMEADRAWGEALISPAWEEYYGERFVLQRHTKEEWAEHDQHVGSDGEWCMQLKSRQPRALSRTAPTDFSPAKAGCAPLWVQDLACICRCPKTGMHPGEGVKDIIRLDDFLVDRRSP